MANMDYVFDWMFTRPIDEYGVSIVKSRSRLRSEKLTGEIPLYRSYFFVNQPSIVSPFSSFSLPTITPAQNFLI